MVVCVILCFDVFFEGLKFVMVLICLMVYLFICMGEFNIIEGCWFI